MARTEKHLGQSRPSTTTAATLYQPAASVEGTALELIVCNTTGLAATFRFFKDPNGTTYDETTALDWNVSIDGGASLHISLHQTIDELGSFGVRTGTGNALTFTLNGYEKT